MAKRLGIPSEELKLHIVGPYDSLDIARVQRVTFSSDTPTTNIYEIGNNTLAGTAKDIPNITVAFSLFDVSIKAFATLTGTNPAAYPAAGVDIAELDEVDAILYVKDETVSDYIKSCHGRRLQVRDFSFSYSVDGESTEDYNLIGSEKRWFKNDVIVDRFTTGTTTFTLSQTPIQLKNGNYLLSVILNGSYLEETTDPAPVSGEYYVTGTTVTTGDARTTQIILVYHAVNSATNWTYVSDSTVPAATRGRDVKIEIAANSIPRVQNVTINGNLNAQPVREMGNTAIVGYQKQTAEVTGTITVLDTDTELLDLLLNGSTSSGDTEFEVGVECVSSGVGIEVKIYDPCDDTSILKTVYVPEIVVTGDSYTSNINQNASATFNWTSNTSECIVYSGAR
jgi:hypothetical protein